MALRLARAFDTSAERWMAMQQQYDLWQARKAVKLGKVRRLVEQRRLSVNRTPPGGLASAAI
jgi:plasmid maintenance system antidote protein VapI